VRCYNSLITSYFRERILSDFRNKPECEREREKEREREPFTEKLGAIRFRRTSRGEERERVPHGAICFKRTLVRYERRAARHATRSNENGRPPVAGKELGAIPFQTHAERGEERVHHGAICFERTLVRYER